MVKLRPKAGRWLPEAGRKRKCLKHGLSVQDDEATPRWLVVSVCHCDKPLN